MEAQTAGELLHDLRTFSSRVALVKGFDDVAGRAFCAASTMSSLCAPPQ